MLLPMLERRLAIHTNATKIARDIHNARQTDIYPPLRLAPFANASKTGLADVFPSE